MSSNVTSILDRYLAGVREEVIKCRLRGHWWDTVGPENEYGQKGSGRDLVLTQAIHCERCGSDGEDHFDRVTRRRVGTREYDYCDDYLLDHPGAALGRDEIRRWLDSHTTARPARRLRKVS
jgi:hypothetical protein